MMSDARAGAFDILIVEALDRVSRDQEDLPAIYKRLDFLGIKMVAVHDGVADKLQIGIRGLVGTLYLQDLAHKVHRGLAGVVRDGRHPGGRAYGYKAVLGKPGELEIIEDEARIVRRIFSEYVDGRTPRDIVSRLNAEKIRAPRGPRWNASALNGNCARGHGILVNPIYAGKLVWNRVRMVKNPDTGKRVSRVNPREEWMVSEAPELAIIDQSTFDAAQEKKKARGGLRPGYRQSPKHILSGLLKCSQCGGGLAVKDKDHGRVRVQCTTAKESGSCGNKHVLYLDKIEERVLKGLQQRLSDRRLFKSFLDSYNQERARVAGDTAGKRKSLERDLANVTAEHRLAQMDER